MKVHHNTLKKAAANGVQLKSQEDGRIEAINNDGEVLASGQDPRDVLDLAIVALNDGGGTIESTKPARAAKPKTKKHKTRSDDDGEEGDEDDGDGDGDDGEPKSQSVIKDKYKVKYQPNKMTCGDGMVDKLRRYTTVEVLGKVQVGGKRRKTVRISLDLIEKLARANNLWNPEWRKIRDRHGNVNVGMIRMNLGNRLRGLERHKVEIKWPK